MRVNQVCASLSIALKIFLVRGVPFGGGEFFNRQGTEVRWFATIILPSGYDLRRDLAVD